MRFGFIFKAGAFFLQKLVRQLGIFTLRDFWAPASILENWHNLSTQHEPARALLNDPQYRETPDLSFIYAVCTMNIQVAY